MNCSANESRVKACFDYAECSQQCLEGEIKCKGTLFSREAIILKRIIILIYENSPYSFQLISLKIKLESMMHK